MCGISGFLGSSKEKPRPLLQALHDAQRNRGPHAKGIWISSDKRVGLAHRRLSTVDLTQANHRGGSSVLLSGHSSRRKDVAVVPGRYAAKRHSADSLCISAYSFVWSIWSGPRLRNRLASLFSGNLHCYFRNGGGSRSTRPLLQGLPLVGGSEL